jgi:hypothetical protein
MGNLPSSIFCPSKDQRPYSADSLPDPPGHGACPTVPAGMSQLVLNIESQHGSSTNIEPLDVRLAPSEPFAPVTSLPERHWQTAMQATVTRPTPQDPKRSSDKNHNPFSIRHHGRKNNDAPKAGGVKTNHRGTNAATKHSGLYSATSGDYVPHPKHQQLKSSAVQSAIRNADVRDGFFNPYFPPRTKHIKHTNRAPKHPKYQASKKKPKEPKECAILSEKDLDKFTKQLQRLCVHMDITHRNEASSHHSSRDIDHEETCATNDRRRAVNEAHLALKYYRTLRRQLDSRRSTQARHVQNVMNVRTNNDWRSTNQWRESQSAMVTQLIDQGVVTPVDGIEFHPHCLDDEIEPGDKDTSESDNEMCCPNEHCNELYCQPVGTDTIPAPTASNCGCHPTFNVRANAKWRNEAKHHSAMVTQVHGDPFTTPAPDNDTIRPLHQASSFEEENETHPPTITPINRTTSPALNAFNNLGNRFQSYLRPTASVPPALNTTVDTECDTTMASPDYIANRTAEFVAQFESMNNEDLQHVAQILKIYEQSGLAPHETDVFLTIPSTDTSSIFDEPSVLKEPPNARAQPPRPPDDDPSSSDSSLSSESSSSDSSSDDESKHRRKKNKKKKKSRGGTRRTKQERNLEKVTKLNRTLSSTAYRKKVKTLKNDTNPKTRRITFFNWISSIHDIFDMYHDTRGVLENYPKLPDSIDPRTNEAIAAFLRSYIDIDIRHLMNSVARTDGLGLLQRLKTIYASATLADQQRALVNLQNLEMHPHESMTSIVSRFRKSLQALHHATADPSLLPHDKSLVMMFIQKLKDNTNMSPDLRQQVNQLEFASLDDACLLTLTDVEDRLCMIESLAIQRSQRTRGHGGSGQPAKTVTCTYCNKTGHMADVCRSRLRKTSSNHQANHVTAKTPNKFRKPVTCFSCGGSHHLRDCKKCDEAEKERLYREHLGPRKTNDTRQRNTQAHQAQATEPPVPPSSIRGAASKPPPEQAHNTQILNIGRPSLRGTRWASANMTTVHEDPTPTPPERLLYIGGVPFTCNSSKPESVPLSSKPKFNCLFRQKVPTDTLRIKSKLCCRGNQNPPMNDPSDDDSCNSMPGLLPRSVPARVLNWADASSDDESDDSMPPLKSRSHLDDDSSSSSSSDDDSCDSVPHLQSRSYLHDDSSSDDDSSIGDQLDDNDSWTFIPNEYAHTANDLTPLGESAMNTMVPHDTDNPVSRISDWLIDSGASSHMTPHRSDLVHNVERSHAIVEVANGVLIRAELRGTVRIKLVDINDAEQSCDILVHDVIYVPGLSRRLLSVDQWMAAGGDIHFNMNHTTIRVVDSDTDESRSFDVPKPFPNPKSPHQASDNACQADTPAPKKAVPASLLHRRLGHRTINTMIVGSKNEVWSDTTLRLEADNFCDSCQIVTARAANRGKSPLDVGTLDMQPGESVMVDLVTNLNKHGLTTSSHFKYYVLVTDVKTRFTVPIGTNRKTPADIARCLATWATDYGPDTTFNLYHLKKLRGDADESYFSTNFIAVLLEHRINGTFAAPRHQEQNGICERTWQSIRDIAFKTMVFAHVGDEFYDFAIEHAWKVFNLLPLRDLVDANGDPCTPIGAYTGTKPKLSRLRVLFCPCVINNGQTKRHIDPAKPKKARKVNTRQNCAERGTKAIHVGLPRYQNGWLCYIPSTGGLRVSQDVSFDEHFYSTTAHFDSSSRFTGGIANMPISLPLIPQSHELERTGNAWPFTHADDDVFDAHVLDTDDEAIQRFANSTVDELFDQVEEEPLLSQPTIDSDDESSSAASLSAMERLDLAGDWAIPVDTAPLFAPPTRSFDYHESDSSSDDDSHEETPLPARRPRIPTNHYTPVDFNAYTASRASLERHAVHHAHAFHSGDRDLPAESYMRSAFQAEVNDVSVTGEPADPFQPEPAHWRQILTMPEHIKVHWINSFRKELRVLFKMNTFSKDVTVLDTDDIIPVTAKYRTKLQSNGTIEKLKTRICLRGDLQSASEMDTWCAIAGFRALKIFLAVAARTKCRVYQLDFIGAFLQSYAIDRTVTMLPVEWKELFPEYADWFGIPLLCVKSIYGGSYANRSFDIHLSTWLENDQRLMRCLSEGSIFTRRDGDKFLILLNAVDDQLYMSNCDEMRKQFETDISTNFDVELMGQAHWYLQARITQHANFDITLDQSRYGALICNRFIPSLPIDTITPEDCETYKRPLPDGFIATKEDQAKDMFEVKRLADEFGFKYSSVVGMLIFSMNTFIYLHFGVRKLAKFNTRPGRKHYEAAAHFLRHLRCNTRRGGIRYYANLSDSPFTKLLASFDGPVDYPVVLCTDASWQDCPDTSRSTGCYMIFVQGGIVDAASFVPNPIALSSAESEYNAGAFGVTAAQHVRQLFQELHGLDPDTSLSIPLVMDSSSAIAIASKSRDTRHTRHIQRRVHFVRFEFLRGNHFGVKILGTLNPSDIGTKHVDSATLETHRLIVQVTVPA